MSGQFEPFPGQLSLRLLGFQSKRVLTARDGDDSVHHVPESSKTDNEFWYMVALGEQQTTRSVANTSRVLWPPLRL